MIVRTYSELSKLKTFEERFQYLKLSGGIGRSTFGIDRYLNQIFYSSSEWKDIRQKVIHRDNGCDLGISGYEIYYRVLIHHMNPISIDDFLSNSELILDPEFLITTTHDTHNAIHFGVEKLIPKVVVERSPGDTRLWGRVNHGR